MRYIATVAIAAAVVLAGCERGSAPAGGGGTAGAPGAVEQRAEDTMDTQQLISLIRMGHDDRAIEVATASGPSVFGPVEPLLSDPSPETRAIALRVLDAADRERARPLAVKALGDPTDEVKTFAVAVLRPDPPSGHMPEMLSAFATARDPALRGEIALLAGRVKPPEMVDAWRANWLNEEDPYAKADVCKALAKMGDEKAREAYVAQMKQAKGRAVFDLVRGTDYFEETWIVPHLALMLDRTDVAIHLAPDFPDTHPFRVCDVAVEAVLKATGEQVGFATPRPTPYSEDEIAQVRKIAAGYGG